MEYTFNNDTIPRIQCAEIDPIQIPLEANVRRILPVLQQDPTAAVHLLATEPPSVIMKKFGVSLPNDGVVHRKNFFVCNLLSRPNTSQGFPCKLKGRGKGIVYVGPNLVAFASRKLGFEYKVRTACTVKTFLILEFRLVGG